MGSTSHIFLVADCVGGSPAREEASALAIKSIENFLVNTLKWFFQLKGSEKENALAEFLESLRQADASIFSEVEKHPELIGMGTTLTLAYSLAANLFVPTPETDRIAATLQAEPDPKITCERLVAQVIEQGGHDNFIVERY